MSRAGEAASALLSIGFLGVLSGCAGMALEDQAPLPFRVAIVPFKVEELQAAPRSTEGARHGLRLERAFNADLAWQCLMETLDRSRFTHTAMLGLPSGVGLDEFKCWPREKQDAYMVQASEAMGANLVVECDMKVSREVRSGLNEKFWLNLPLFLIGGPFAYFVSDRSYQVDAQLTVTMHAADAIFDGRASLADGRAGVIRHEVAFRDVDLNFLERARFRPLWYLASLAVPPGFLATYNEDVQAGIEWEIDRGLARDLGRQIQRSSRAIRRAEKVADFYLSPDTAVSREGPLVSVRGEAILLYGNVERMERYTVSCGGNSVTGEFEQGEVDRKLSTERERFLRYPFVVEVPLEGPCDSLRIELVAGGRDRHRRSFALPLPGGSRPVRSLVR